MRPTRLMLDSGTVVSISKIVAYKSSGDGGRHQRSVRLPASSEVQSVSLDVQQCGHDCLHQERREHSILLSAEVVRSQGNQAGASPSTRSAQHPGGCTVQDRPDSQHWVDVDHGTSTTSVFQVGRTADRHVCYVCQQMTDQVFLTISGPQGRVDGCDVFLPFKLVPQALQKIYQSHEVQMILVAPKQETASWFPELLELSQQDLIPLYAQGQPLLTQDVILPDRETETGHQIYMRGDFAGHPKGKGTFTGSCRYDVKIPTLAIASSSWNTLGKIHPFL